ncbi:MAG: C1 family peptidase [Bacteroidia bacterium]
MPIRMEKDPDSGRDQSPNNPRPGGGGGSSLLKFLPMVLMFLLKKPKLLVPVLVIGGLFYFFGGSTMCNSAAVDDGGGGGGDFLFSKSLGANFDEAKYDAVLKYTPLAEERNTFPSQASLVQYAPQRRHQGEQGSCVGWASAYAARSILFNQANGTNNGSFSPSFLYNHIALRGCQGSYLPEAMEFMRKVGALPYTEFPYNPRECRKPQVNQTMASRANQFRIRGYDRLTMGHNDPRPNIKAIREHIADGGPVVIGMQVGQSFMQGMLGKAMWNPTRSDYNMSNMGGHAMTVIGYDDKKSGGAFQLMNSWGDNWGQNGIGWVTYKDFNFFVKEAFGIYPMGRAEDPNETRLNVKFGLINTASGKFIRMRDAGGRVFKSEQSIRKGDKFKVAINNSAPCYVYIFGEETDGSCYTLYPYTAKHSAYFGVLGSRVFPDDHSLVADNQGSTDRIAVIFSKKEMDWNMITRFINNSRQRSFDAKIKEAMGNLGIENASFTAGESIQFSADVGEKPTLGVILELNKR